jgi:polar amino acid transport system substrate-binding protein
MEQTEFISNRVLSKLLSAVLITLAFTSAALCQDRPPRPLIWAGDGEGGMPYVSRNPKNPSDYLGFEADIARALARELGRPVQFRQYEFAFLFSGLQRGDFDFAMNGIEITPDRKKAMLFSVPYYVYRLQLTVRSGENRFHSLDQCQGLRGLTVGTMDNTSAARVLDRLHIAMKTYPGPAEAYNDLARGQTDGVLLDVPMALYYANPETDQRFQSAGAPILPGYYAIAVAPSNRELVERLDRALTHMVQSGELRQILEKWKLWNDDQNLLGRDQKEPFAVDLGREWTVTRYVPLLLASAGMTVLITFLSMGLAMLIGLLIAAVRLYGPAPLRWLCLVYVEFFRGIPVLLLLYFLYYGLPQIALELHLGYSLNLTPFTAAILGLGLNYAAYESEIYRSGIGSLPIGQWEAAASLGMSSWVTFRRIIMPQAIRVILPPMTNDFVGLFKDTSIVSVITVVELSKQYQILSKESLKFGEIGLVTALLYLVMSVPLGYLSRYLERRWSAAVRED